MSKASFYFSGEEAQVLVCNSINVCVLERQHRGGVESMNGVLEPQSVGAVPFLSFFSSIILGQSLTMSCLGVLTCKMEIIDNCTYIIRLL